MVASTITVNIHPPVLIVVVALRLTAVSYDEGVSKPIVNFSHCHRNSPKQVHLTPLSSLEVGCDCRGQHLWHVVLALILVFHYAHHSCYSASIPRCGAFQQRYTVQVHVAVLTL